jgi:tRNA threonylcarbamoyladenosine biosynthesis protein TsaB
MIVLALDTCLAACASAVSRDDVPIGWATEPMTRGHQERLAPMVADLMAAHGLSFGAIDRIAVTVGPGSFTGLRVGLAFAKGLALALDRPCVGVGTLEALAASLEAGGPAAIVVDAGRGQVYLQLFENGLAISGPDVLPSDLAVSRVAEIFPSGELVLGGPGAHLISGALRRATIAEIATPDPRAIARLGARAPLVSPRPLYLRPPDAKVKAA